MIHTNLLGMGEAINIRNTQKKKTQNHITESTIKGLCHTCIYRNKPN